MSKLVRKKGEFAGRVSLSRRAWSSAKGCRVPKRLRTYKSALDLVRQGSLMTSEYIFSEVTRTEAKMQWFKKVDMLKKQNFKNQQPDSKG